MMKYLTNEKVSSTLLRRIEEESEKLEYGKIVITFVPGTITLEVTKSERFFPGDDKNSEPIRKRRQ